MLGVGVGRKGSSSSCEGGGLGERGQVACARCVRVGIEYFLRGTVASLSNYLVFYYNSMTSGYGMRFTMQQ